MIKKLQALKAKKGFTLVELVSSAYLLLFSFLP